MADPSNPNSSFIPKRGPVTRRVTTASNQVYVFTLISYVLIFATLLGTGATYLYSEYVQSRLSDEVGKLNVAIQGFNDSDMKRVQDFDERLQQALQRFDNGVSIVSIFKILEEATIDTVKIDSFSLTRQADDKFLLSTSMQTDSFDSTIFQRSVYKLDKYEVNKAVSSIDIGEVSRSSVIDEFGGRPELVRVSFSAELEVPLSAVVYKEQNIASAASIEEMDMVPVDEVVPVPASSPDSQTEEDLGLEDVNQFDI